VHIYFVVPFLKVGMHFLFCCNCDVADVMLPRRVGEEHCSKISAGESVLVIKTPKGLYIRTEKGRVYAVNASSQSSMSANAAWRHEPETVSFHAPFSPSLYAASGAVLDDSAGVQCDDGLMTCSVLSGDPHSLAHIQSAAISRATAIAGMSSDVADSSCSFSPMSFLNMSTPCDGNVACVDSGEVSCSPAAAFPRLAEQQDSAAGVVQWSSSAADLPADLLCIDAAAGGGGALTDTSLPALTVRDQQTDSNSSDSLMFDDSVSTAVNFCTSVAPVFDTGCHLPPYCTYSDINIASTSATATSVAAAATNSGGLDVDDSDITDTSADWSELFALMNETNL